MKHRGIAIPIFSALVAACSFIDDFPEVTDVVGGGGEAGHSTGGQVPGGGGNGGMGGGTTCIAPTTRNETIEFKPPISDNGSMDIRGMRLVEGRPLVVGQNVNGLEETPLSFDPQIVDRQVNLVIGKPAGNAGQILGWSRECGGTTDGYPTMGKRIAYVNGAPTVSGGFVMDGTTTIGFAIGAGNDPCDDEKSSASADHHQVPHLVRYTNSPGIQSAIAAGPVNAMPVAIAGLPGQGNDTEAAMLGMFAANTSVFGSDGSASTPRWFVTRFNGSAQPVDTLESGRPAYDVLDPAKDFGDLAYDEDGLLWLTVRDCSNDCAARIMTQATSSSAFTNAVTVTSTPSTATSMGSVIAVRGDQVVVGGSLEGTLTFANGGQSVDVTAVTGTDTYLMMMDRSSRQPRWGAVLDLPDFDAPTDIAFATVCGVDAVILSGCSGSSSGDCNSHGSEATGDATTAFVAAFELSTGHRLFLKEIHATEGEATSPLFASGAALAVDGDQLWVAMNFAGLLEEDGTTLLIESPKANNGLYEEASVVFSMTLP